MPRYLGVCIVLSVVERARPATPDDGGTQLRDVAAGV